jgi:hypothetical protein
MQFPVELPNTHSSLVQSFGKKIPPPLLTSKLGPIAGQEAIKNINSAHPLIITTYDAGFRNINPLFVMPRISLRGSHW